LRRILVPRELGEESRLPVDYAATIARAAGARLLLLHALDYFQEGADPSDLRVPELQLDLGAQARERLRQVLRGSAGDEAAELIVVPGRPQAIIPRAATERDVDLVVLGFEPRRTIARTLVGATLSHATGSGACPVLAVPLA
jgi:nucleotide-binding universal stress UspA family protein